jgi:hypothetical protein
MTVTRPKLSGSGALPPATQMRQSVTVMPMLRAEPSIMRIA